MISFESARKLVVNSVRILSAEEVMIEDAVGKILAEKIVSPIDMPPFDKSAMDGYAVRSQDVRDVPIMLKQNGLIQAGDRNKYTVHQGQCVKIMTGAALPQGTDAVVMVEDTATNESAVTIKRSVKRGENICKKGEDIRRGQVLLREGIQLTAAEVALLATVGRHKVKVKKNPRVAVINTGGEIISPGEKLVQNKIYNSNGPVLMSLLKNEGVEPVFLGIVRDDPKELAGAFKRGLESDVLLISGGVSMGDYDFVPKVLKKLNVKGVFHRVRMKPGKPFFFGMKGKCAVFGLPGNPVSNFLAYYLFIAPALHKMQGKKIEQSEFKLGVLQENFKHKKGRKHFVLTKIVERRGTYSLRRVFSHGSADVISLSKSDGFFIAEAHQESLKKGSSVRFFQWR